MVLRRRTVLVACERGGLEILAVHSKKWSVGFRRQWRAEFAIPEVDWQSVREEWDILGTELAPARERRSAIRHYDEARLEAATSFITQSLNFEEVYEVRGKLPEHAWLRREMGASDVYIVDGEWRWSFVMTHEEIGLGIGPFFVLRREQE